MFGSELISIANKDGSTPLHFACWNGQLAVVKYMIEELDVANNLIMKTQLGNTPLNQAASQGQLEVVKYLMVEGHCAEILNIKNKKGNTPLHQGKKNHFF